MRGAPHCCLAPAQHYHVFYMSVSRLLLPRKLLCRRRRLNSSMNRPLRNKKWMTSMRREQRSSPNLVCKFPNNIRIFSISSSMRIGLFVLPRKCFKNTIDSVVDTSRRNQQSCCQCISALISFPFPDTTNHGHSF